MLYCNTATVATIQHGLGSWGASVGAGSAGRRAGCRLRAGRASASWRQAQACRQTRVRRSERQAKRAVGWATSSRRVGRDSRRARH